MQSRINLWLWRYKNVKASDGIYHLRADEGACRLIIEKLRTPAFIKASFGLRQVPGEMTKILSVKDPRFVGFENFRVFRGDNQEEIAVFNEASLTVDFYLTDAGITEFTNGLELMLAGRWDFNILDTWFWGIISDHEFRKIYGAS